MSVRRYFNSPPWSSSSKRSILLLLLILMLLLLYQVRSLLLPMIMALVLAYLVEPLVRWISQRTRLPRLLTIVIIYLVITAALISIPVSAIPPIVTEVNNLIDNVPRFLQQLGEFLQRPLTIASITIPINEMPLEQVYSGISGGLISLVQSIGGQSVSILGSIAGATISTVGWTFLILFLSFYLVKDHELLIQAVTNLVPVSYRGDMLLLSDQISATWNAFLRGQLVLCLVMAVIVFILALIIGLPNALLLALIAGLAEFLPTIGPILAAIPATLFALFQSETSWIGAYLSPFWFATLILGIYGIIFQLENYYLVPRIMGQHLRLHPLVVILGALAGASVAGLLGVLLAAPVLATTRLVFIYLYCKLTDRPPFPNLILLRQADGPGAFEEE